MASRLEHGEDHHGVDALDVRRLRYFIALAEELHFGRAADRLQIAQPPLSRLVGRIEADVGAKLVDRSRSQIRLTQAGKVCRRCPGDHPSGRRSDCRSRAARVRQERSIANRFCRICYPRLSAVAHQDIPRATS